MPKRHTLLAANWKMNPPPQGFDMPISPYRSPADVDVLVLPSFADIDRCIAAGLTVGGQTGRPEQTGPFTGDVSMAMLAAHGCRAVLCGHSDRREHHGETDEQIGAQVQAAIGVGLLPILCVGEKAQQRDAGIAGDIVQAQLTAAVNGVSIPIIIAYEPVWAIGTGKTPVPIDIQEMHANIRSWLPPQLAESPVLYGGSVQPENAAEIFACPDVDGALVGGASLDSRAFSSILESLRSSPH